MKKLLTISLLLFLILACKKTKNSPEGPTDVRVKNISDSAFTEVVVKIKDEEISYGTINKSGLSDYKRFKTAFPKAEISARINGVPISTGAVDYTYMNYFGLVRLTYEVQLVNNMLKIEDVILDSELKIK